MIGVYKHKGGNHGTQVQRHYAGRGGELEKGKTIKGSDGEEYVVAQTAREKNFLAVFVKPQGSKTKDREEYRVYAVRRRKHAVAA